MSLLQGAYKSIQDYFSSRSRNETKSLGISDIAESKTYISDQACYICYRNIRKRLRRDSIPGGCISNVRAPTFQSEVDEDIVMDISLLVEALERSHPKTYSNISIHLQTPLDKERIVMTEFRKFTQELFRNGIKWSLVLALLAFTCALSEECARQGCSRFINRILQTLRQLMENNLNKWILQHGGWNGMVRNFQEKKSQIEEVVAQSILMIILKVFTFITLFVFTIFAWKMAMRTT